LSWISLRMEIRDTRRITIEAGKCGGKPCIRGQRIRVTDILSLMAAGASHDEILADYPSLEKEDLFAALQFAANLTNSATKTKH
jgi:uncharacterized protein (DUF433 family)